MDLNRFFLPTDLIRTFELFTIYRGKNRIDLGYTTNKEFGIYEYVRIVNSILRFWLSSNHSIAFEIVM